MTNQPRANFACSARTSTMDTLSPVEIAEVIDTLAARIRTDGNADLLGPWAISRLSAKLGVTVAISSSTNLVEVVEDLGDAFGGAIRTVLDEHPGEVVEVLRAAKAVIEGVVEDVKRRGVAG